MGCFYYAVAASMAGNFSQPEAGKMTPYSAMLCVFTGNARE